MYTYGQYDGFPNLKKRRIDLDTKTGWCEFYNFMLHTTNHSWPNSVFDEIDQMMPQFGFSFARGLLEPLHHPMMQPRIGAMQPFFFRDMNFVSKIFDQLTVAQ